MTEEEKHIIAVIVENKPGVLYSVSNMFRRRGFNIDSISVGSIDGRDLARMTITLKGDERKVEQVIKQLNKLIDVIKVSKLNPINIIVREMALVKIHASDTRSRSDIVNYANIFRAGIVDVSSETLTVEITGDSEKIDAFVNLMRSFGIREIARTGVTALSRGEKSVKIEQIKG